MMGVGPTPSPSSAHHTPLAPGQDGAPTNVSVDIGGIVTKYNKMLDFLYPLELISKAILYVIRYKLSRLI